jgi:peptide/nickel transport system substrate-binding protein
MSRLSWNAGRRIQRLLAFGGAVLAVGLILAACGGSNSSSTGGGGNSSKGSNNGNNANTAASQFGTVLYGSLPAVGTPKPGGTITLGQLTGQTPTYIFPIIPGASTSTGTIEFVSSLFMPLYYGPSGAEPKVDYNMSAASGPPKLTDGDKTATITLKSGLKWSDGKPIQANDVVFMIDLMKAAVKESPANWGQYVPGEFPQSVVSTSTPNPTTVVMHLDKPYNPGFFLYNQVQDTNNVFPLPSTVWNVASANGPHLDYSNPANAKKIYDYLNKAGGSVAQFAASPLWKTVSGPFKLTTFSATNSSYAMVPNPTYGGSPKAQYDQLQVNTYTGFDAELNAVKSGSLDIAVGIDPSQLAQAGTLKSQGITLFGGPGFGWFGGIINFKDTANHFDKVISQLYVRQAIAHLEDQPGIIKGVYKGAAVTSYGPVPSAPDSPYTPADAVTPPYPYSPSTAVSLLKSHGWKVVPNGQTTCQKAGTASDECGAGIPAGTPLKFVWANQPSSASTTGVLESEAVASEAKQAAGINIELSTKSFNFLTSNYNDQNPAAAKYTNDWGVNNYGGLYEDYYPTQDGVDNPGGGFNLGDYNDPTASKLIHASVFGGDPNAVKAEASYLTKSLPVFYLPNQDYLLAVSTKVGGPSDSFLIMTQQATSPNEWYLVK